MRTIVIASVVLALSFAIGWALGPTLRSAAHHPARPCAVTLAGSNTIGERLAPAVASAFLASRGYDVQSPQTVRDGEVRIVGVREGVECVLDIRSHGSSQAFEELVKGTADIGMASRPIKETEIDALRQAGSGDFAVQASTAEHVVA